MTLDFSRPGKPTDNAVIESFNGRLRDECLNPYWFLVPSWAQRQKVKTSLKIWCRTWGQVMPATFSQDPADRLIVAIARAGRLPLATHDARIRRSRQTSLWVV